MILRLVGRLAGDDEGMMEDHPTGSQILLEMAAHETNVS
jgi:hypothetical protein